MMAKQDISVTKKLGRPKSAPTSVVRLPDAVLEAADKWASKQPDQPTRPEAIRRLVELGLQLPAAASRTAPKSLPKQKKGLTGMMVKR
jgi:hypothetical protein